MSVDVSVLMPVYNAESYLEAAVQSILRQSYATFEFIVIDDGSTDESINILRRLECLDPRMTVVSRPNIGIAGTRNELVERAKGRLIAWMDADDIALPDRLDVQVEFLAEFHSVVAVGSFYEIIDDNDRRIHVQRLPTGDSEMQDAALRGITPMCNPCVMMRADAIREVGQFDKSVEPAEDLDMFLRLGEVGELANIGRVLMKYRIHRESASGMHASKQINGMRDSVERAGARRGVEVNFDAHAGWRPGPGRVSQYLYKLKYGWWAFNLGELGTAAVYARRAIIAIPWRVGGWRLLVCVLREFCRNYRSRDSESK